ncbi:hypothetical protein GCM10027421_31070 [Microbacterium shaanxiense]
MTPKNESDSAEDDSRGVLDEAASLDTTGIGILGQTAQVSVALPQHEDDDLVDDAVVDGEILSELIVDPPLEAAAVSVADERVGRIQEDRIGIIIELPAEEPAATATDPVPVPEADDDVAEGVIEPDAASEPESGSEPGRDAEPAATSDSDREIIVDPVIAAAPAATAAPAAAAAKPKTKKKPRARPAAKPEPTTASGSDTAPEPATAIESEIASETVTESQPTSEPVSAPDAEPAAASEDGSADKSMESAVAPREAKSGEARNGETGPRGESATSAWIAAALKKDASSNPTPAPAASVPAEKAKSETVMNSQEDQHPAEKTAETAIAQRPAVSRPEVALTSKRLGDQLGESSRESADLLTADRLLDPHQVTKPEPEGAWSHFLYAASGRRINIGDGRRARERKALTARIAAPLVGGARFVPVLSRKGGVGKTTITALLGMALADARDDRVIAVDANPDRGTLADRIVRTHSRSVRDLVRIHDDVKGYHDVSSIVARDSTRLDVLASDADPRIAEAFSDDDYRDVADVAAHYYSLVLTDTGTGIVHSVMGATLDLADQLIIVSGLSVDEARLASETLTWLETNGYAELARRSIVVLNQSTPGSPLVRLNELEAHFATRAKSVVRMPYDSQIAGGGAIVFANLQPETRQAARELAASLVEGLRASAA